MEEGGKKSGVAKNEGEERAVSIKPASSVTFRHRKAPSSPRDEKSRFTRPATITEDGCYKRGVSLPLVSWGCL